MKSNLEHLSVVSDRASGVQVFATDGDDTYRITGDGKKVYSSINVQVGINDTISIDLTGTRKLIQNKSKKSKIEIISQMFRLSQT